MSLQNKIIKLLKVKPYIDAYEEINKITKFIKNYLKKNLSLKTLVMGISGGQDSTLTGKLCQKAIKELREENYNKNNYMFIAIRMPYGIQLDEADCKDAISFIKPDRTLVINIKQATLCSEKSLKCSNIIISDYIRGNIKARERMKIQYAIANLTQGLVVGTTNAAELVTGYFTKYGDGANDINPILNLNKRQGKKILQYLNCPDHLYLKDPTADLEDNKPNLPDEIALGITYNNIDDYLEGKFINNKLHKIIEDLYLKNQHKNNQCINENFQQYQKN